MFPKLVLHNTAVLYFSVFKLFKTNIVSCISVSWPTHKYPSHNVLFQYDLFRFASNSACLPAASPPPTPSASNLIVVDTAAKAKQTCEDIMNEVKTANERKVVGFDSEGIVLGRFGKLCVVQLSTEDSLIICDALKPPVVKAIAPLLTSTQIIKVGHDVREDISALYHQHGIKFNTLYDTQVAHSLIIKKEFEEGRGYGRGGMGDYQAGMSEMLRDYLTIYDNISNEMKKHMSEDNTIWFKRPLNSTLVRYALYGVKYLIPLYKSINKKLGVVGTSSPTETVLKLSKRYINYRFLNEKFKAPQDIAIRGTVIQGIVATRKEDSIIFKLNCGRVGIACTPSSVGRFSDIEMGDIADLVVSTVSVNGKFIYVDRLDPLYDNWNIRKRLRYRHETTRTMGGPVDILLSPGIDCEDPDVASHQVPDQQFD